MSFCGGMVFKGKNQKGRMRKGKFQKVGERVEVSEKHEGGRS